MENNPKHSTDSFEIPWKSFATARQKIFLGNNYDARHIIRYSAQLNNDDDDIEHWTLERYCKMKIMTDHVR